MANCGYFSRLSGGRAFIGLGTLSAHAHNRATARRSIDMGFVMAGIVVFEDHVEYGGGGWCRMHALEPVANRPIALHAVDALLAAGVSEIVAVASTDRAGEIRDCLAAELAPGAAPVHVIT